MRFFLSMMMAALMAACDDPVIDVYTDPIDEPTPVQPVESLDGVSSTVIFEKASYVVGEIPKAKVILHNRTGQEIVLSKGLDGSEVGWRFPKCGFEIFDENKERIQPQPIGRCGNMSTLRVDDFVEVPDGGDMNLSENGYAGFSGLYQISQKPGTYWVRHYYHTSGGSVSDYFGDERMMERPKVDSAIRKLAEQVPKVSVYSEMVKVVIEEKTE